VIRTPGSGSPWPIHPRASDVREGRPGDPAVAVAACRDHRQSRPCVHLPIVLRPPDLARQSLSVRRISRQHLSAASRACSSCRLVSRAGSQASRAHILKVDRCAYVVVLWDRSKPRPYPSRTRLTSFGGGRHPRNTSVFEEGFADSFSVNVTLPSGHVTSPALRSTLPLQSARSPEYPWLAGRELHRAPPVSHHDRANPITGHPILPTPLALGAIRTSPGGNVLPHPHRRGGETVANR